MSGAPSAPLTHDLLVLEHDVLKAIATGEPLASAMDLLCRRVEALAPAVVCSILRVDDNGIVHPLAGPSLPAQYSAALDGMRIGPKAGSCGTAAFRREMVDVKDIATDPLWEDYRHLALPLGLVACWSSPILGRDGAAIGTFAFYRRTPAAENCDIERQIVETCVPLCAIAIEHETARAEAERLAYRDVLTGLANRAALFDRARRMIAGSDSAGGLALICLDLDGFKEVNDALGHWAGDQLLAAVGERLLAFGDAENGEIARLGGDEFALLRRGDDVAGTDAAAKRLLAVFEEPFPVEGHAVPMRASVGIAFREPGDDDFIDLMKNADLALYSAKAEGGGRHRFFHAGLAAAAHKRRELERDLRSAIEAEELLVVYQPIVDLATGAVTGCEGLVRWRHRTGLRMPAEFIGLAEEAGLIAPIGAWVLEEACRQAVRWPDDTYVAINLSAIQLREPGFATDVAAMLGRTGLPATRLQLEITESVLLAENPVTHTTLSELRAMGVGIALDDFGTGYSSLRSVRAFRPDKIKIDKSFVRELGEHDHSTTIIRTVIALARNLGMMTTAEGIEMAEHARLLLAEGCREGQGYHFARPMAAEDVEAVLRDRSMLGSVPEPRAAAG